eukprot:SAG22_NODE_361_length_11712_cov_6.108155_6_plen_244_part_00
MPFHAVLHNTQAVLSELNSLVDEAAILRFYYPGSPLWQVQRKQRANETVSKGRNCCRVRTTEYASVLAQPSNLGRAGGRAGSPLSSMHGCPFSNGSWWMCGARSSLATQACRSSPFREWSVVDAESVDMYVTDPGSAYATDPFAEADIRDSQTKVRNPIYTTPDGGVLPGMAQSGDDEDDDADLRSPRKRKGPSIAMPEWREILPVRQRSSLLKAVITAFPSVSLPFLAVPLRSQPTVAIRLT